MLVEGTSDRFAVEALARRCGRNLVSDRVAVVSMGGATNVSRFLERFGPAGLDLCVAGLCDLGEIGYFRRALERSGAGAGLTREAMEGRGFFVCVADLEDELIRALGTDAMERFIDDQGELDTFRTFQKQPAQRGRPVTEHLHRFIGTRSGRKNRYAPALIDALDLTRTPLPLERLLDHV